MTRKATAQRTIGIPKPLHQSQWRTKDEASQQNDILNSGAEIVTIDLAEETFVPTQLETETTLLTWDKRNEIWEQLPPELQQEITNDREEDI